MKEKKEKLIVPGFVQFGGKHCQTTALKSVLDYHGLYLSEEMLLGLGGGIGFTYWYMKRMPAPFIGMKNLLRNNEPAFVFVDMPYLPYLAIPAAAHFGGHTVVVFGVDEEVNKVYIADRCKNPVTVSIEDVKNARNSKFPPFPPKNRLLKIEYPSEVENKSLETGVKAGIRECCENMLNPPIKNNGLAGLKKWADLVMKWPEQFKGLNFYDCLFNTFVFIEVSGTGGSAFRMMYAKFLEEASSIVDVPELNDIAELFHNSAAVWSEIAKAALPDSRPVLKKIRELMITKHKYFEAGEPNSVDKMLEINREEEELLRVVEEDLKNPEEILTPMRNRIWECLEIEKDAFQKLGNIICY